jgi:cbb3-type cytochrome oxidase subunit 1
LRLVAGLFMFAGLIVFVFNIVATWASARVGQRELVVSARS